jgi:2-dehydropantoate 2-reductase
MSIDDIASVVGPARTIGAVIEMASNMFEPGIVNRETPQSGSWFAVGGLDDTSKARAVEVQQLLEHAGTVEVSDDIRSSKWMKLIANAGELVPSAILDMALADAAELPGMRAFMDECGHEAARAAVASGNKLVPIFGLADDATVDSDRYAEKLLDMVLAHYSSPTTRTTVLQDWMKGRRAEVEEINGLVVRTLGDSAPANSRTVEIARRIEAGELKADPSNVELLLGARV